MSIYRSLARMNSDIIPGKEEFDAMISGIVNEILEGMDKDTEEELPWVDFIQFMDNATD